MHGDIVFQDSNSNNMLFLTEEKLVLNIPKIDLSNNDVTWELNPDSQTALKMVDSESHKLMTFSTSIELKHRGLSINGTLNVSDNIIVEDTLHVHGNLDFSKSTTGNIIIASDKNESLYSETR